MKRPDPEYILGQILSYSQEAVHFVKGRSRPDLDEDRLLALALIRLLEMVGEAANRLSEEKQMDYPELPWLQMIGLRNRLIHGYDNVDFDILWQILHEDLPELIIKIQIILRIRHS